MSKKFFCSFVYIKNSHSTNKLKANFPLSVLAYSFFSLRQRKRGRKSYKIFGNLKYNV